METLYLWSALKITVRITAVRCQKIRPDLLPDIVKRLQRRLWQEWGSLLLWLL